MIRSKGEEALSDSDSLVVTIILSYDVFSRTIMVQYQVFTYILKCNYQYRLCCTSRCTINSFSLQPLRT